MKPSLFLDHCTVIDATVPGARPGMAVALLGDRIQAVGPASELQPQPYHQVVDLGGGALLPGLWDVHCHPGVYYPDPEGVSLFETEAERTCRTLRNLTDALHAGVTALRVGGEACYIDVALRDAFDRGTLTGPRLWASGPPLKVTGGHGAYRRRSPSYLMSPVQEPFPASDPWGSREVDGADAFQHAARLNAKMGVDWIKLMITGGIAGGSEGMQERQMTAAEVSAAVEVAHAKGLKVMAHLGGPDAVRMAVACGVDSVEHGYTLDPAAASLMADEGVWYVPTLGVTHNEEYMRRMAWSEMAIEKALAAAPAHREAFNMARAAGVRIANGSDLHPLSGSTTAEIAQLVRCGLTEWEAIVAATLSAAELCGAQEELGTIEPGKKADLIVVPGDPLEEIGRLGSVTMVILDGRIVHNVPSEEEIWHDRPGETG
jgi:imidazolonepropionase-like amidohydrolase